MGRNRRETAAECTVVAHGPAPLEWGGYIIRPTDQKYEDITEAPNEPGVYAWYSRCGDLMYVGKSVAICTRLRQHQMHTAFWATPSLFSFRVVPEAFIGGVERAHINVLRPRENQACTYAGAPFYDDLRLAIEAAWREALPEQQERLDAAYHALAEQIAARLKHSPRSIY